MDFAGTRRGAEKRLGVVMVKSDQFNITPIVASSSLRTLAYEALKAAITNMDIYGRAEEVRLDERKLSQDLGVSRTPVREALLRLGASGLVVAIPGRSTTVTAIDDRAAKDARDHRLGHHAGTDSRNAGLRQGGHRAEYSRAPGPFRPRPGVRRRERTRPGRSGRSW